MILLRLYPPHFAAIVSKMLDCPLRVADVPRFLDVSETGAYYLLRKLERLGIAERSEEPREGRGGRPRHVYSLTEDARRSLEA